MPRFMSMTFRTNLPTLELPDGKTYSQSVAIYMFVARSVGLYPAEAAQQFTVDNILQHCKDAKDVTCECDSRPG